MPQEKQLIQDPSFGQRKFLRGVWSPFLPRVCTDQVLVELLLRALLVNLGRFDARKAF